MNTQLMLNGSPGYNQTSYGVRGSCPIPDKCTIVLLQGSFGLDDENEVITETFVGLQTEGSKTLIVNDNSTIVWFPSVCCWDSSKCGLARKGQCLRNPGVVIPRDPKNPMWWEMDDKKSSCCVLQ
jgi:hypothetical protein